MILYSTMQNIVVNSSFLQHLFWFIYLEEELQQG